MAEVVSDSGVELSIGPPGLNLVDGTRFIQEVLSIATNRSVQWVAEARMAAGAHWAEGGEARDAPVGILVLVTPEKLEEW